MRKLIFSLLFLHFLLPNQIVFGQKPINIQSCKGSQTPACNLVCFGDFENINQAQWDEFSDFDISAKPVSWQTTGMVQTPDLLFGTNYGNVFGGFPLASDPSLVCSTTNGIVTNPNNNNFAHIADSEGLAREGFALPLKEKLIEGKKYRISLNFYTGCDNQLNILLAKNMPCDHTVSSFDGFPNNKKTALQTIDCGKGNVFTPLQTIFHPVLGMTKWQPYSTDITLPKGSDPVAFIIFYTHINDVKQTTSIYYDDIVITEIPDAPVITPVVITQCLPGEIEIDYDISVNSSIQTNYGISLTLKSPKQGVTLNTKKGDFTQGYTNVLFINPKGGVKTVKLFLNVAANASPNQTILLDVETSTDCVDLLPQTIPVNLSLITSSPDFTLSNDCTKLSMEAITKTGSSDKWKVTPKSSPAVVLGTATGITATIALNSTGVFTITHTLITPCGTFTASKDITVNCTVPLCPCLNTFNIGSDKNSITDMKNTPFYKINPLELKNSCISLQGTLRVDKSYTFTDMEMRMGENASIVVIQDRKLTIKGASTATSRIYACTKMWNGITVESNATLDVTKTTIEDAFFAISLRPNANVNIKDNLFKKNYVGIQFKGNNYSDKINFLDLDGLTGNVFTCDNMTLIAPNAGLKSDCGIRIENGSFRVGPIPTAAGGVPTNFFSGLNTGIRCYDGVVTVNRADFFGTPDPLKIGRYTGQGIVGNGDYTQLTVKNCIFTNLYYGIITRYSSQTIDQGNSFTNMLRAIECDAPKYISIKNNTIKDITEGIYMFSSNGAILPNPSEISGNTITVGKPKYLGNPRMLSIYAYSAINSNKQNPNALVIRNNYIYDDVTGEGPVLINISSSINIKLIRNYVYANTYVPPTGLQQSSTGISIWGSNEIRLRDNFIYGRNHQVPRASLVIQGTQGLRLCCNTMTEGSASLLAENMNSTFIRNSHFGAGLTCLFPATSLSVQKDGGNIWDNPDDGAYHAAGTNLALYNQYINTSRFENKATCANTPDWANGKINPPLQYCKTKPSFGVSNEDWFQKIPPIVNGSMSCDLDIECADYIQKKGINNDESPTLEDSLAATGAFETFAYGEATNWELAKRLCEKLLENPNLKDDNVLMNDFFNAANENNISKYALISNKIKHIADLNSEDEESLTTLWNSTKSQEESLSIYAASGEKYDEIKGQVTEAETEIAKNHERYQYVVETLLAKKKKIVESLLLENENIKPQNLWESNEQKVNRIYLKRFISKETTPKEDIKVLANIAYQCVASSGHCVLLARSLYTICDRNANFDLENHYCGEFILKHKTTDVILQDSRIQKNSSSTIAKDLDTAQNVNIYPNPAQDELHINIPSIAENSNIEIQINSLAGATLAKYAWFGNDKYDISRLQNGLYLCYVYENGKIIATKRITILK